MNFNSPTMPVPGNTGKRILKTTFSGSRTKKGKARVSYPFVTGKGITVTQGEVMPEGKIVPARKIEEVEV